MATVPWDPFRAVPLMRKPIWSVFAIAALMIQGPDFVHDLRPSIHEGVDYIQEWLSARNYWTGLPIYTNHRDSIPRHLDLSVSQPDARGDSESSDVQLTVGVNAHPPTSVLLVLPLGLLDYPTSALVWNMLSLLMLGTSLCILSHQLSIRVSLFALVPMVTLLLVCSPFRQQMSQGQLNLVLLLLLTLAWSFSRNGRDGWAGAMLGLATAIKLFPAFLILHFVLMRRWRVLLSALITLTAVTILTAAVLGFQSYIAFVQTSLPQGREFCSDWINASAIGLFQKLFDPLNLHCHTMPLWQSHWAARILGGIACCVIVAVWCRTILRARLLNQQDVAFGISVTTMLLLSPLTWDHYFLLLMIPLGIAWVRLPPTSSMRIVFVTTLIVLNLPPVALWNTWIPGGLADGIATPLHTLTINSYGLYGLLCVLGISSAIMFQGTSLPTKEPL